MPFAFSPSDCIDMLLIFGECQKNCRQAQRLYQERFPDRPIPSRMTFSRVEEKLRTGSFPSTIKHRHHTRSVRTEDLEINVLAYIIIHPHVSIRTLAEEVGVSKSNVQRILKENKYHPFKIQLVQGLKPTDFERRLEFIACIQVILHESPNIFSQILWSDESRFHNNGVVNRHNSHYWSQENPHWVRESNFQTTWGINVWCGLFNGSIIGPYFFNENLNGLRYLHFLENDLIQLMEDIPIAERQGIWWQQDGAPPHNSQVVTEYLDRTYPNRWIGNKGPIRWPARSPDLSPLDFFLWGYLKDIVFTTPPLNVDDLKMKIRLACSDITPDIIRATCTREVIRRFEACIISNGHHFEQFL